MSTSLHASPIYGPVHSRRLGLSLGINLSPCDGKCCSFDCIYCECGFNHERIAHQPLPTRTEVATTLEATLRRMADEQRLPDDITFAGNGEPTMHPMFADIVADTVRLRDRYCPDAQLSVLSNATRLHLPEVRKALMLVDRNILKLDTVDNDYIRRVNRPMGHRYSTEETIRWMQTFNGHVIIQTLFMHGTIDGEDVSNTAASYVTPWIEAVKAIKPQCVMIYTIDRDTPAPDLHKATPEELDAIRLRVTEAGFPCTVAY